MSASSKRLCRFALWPAAAPLHAVCWLGYDAPFEPPLTAAELERCCARAWRLSSAEHGARARRSGA